MDVGYLRTYTSIPNIPQINHSEVSMQLSAIPATGIRQPPTVFWQRIRYIGPSLILTATLVGSGELIVTTAFGAQAGFRALWLIVAACFLKVAVQEEIGRYTISSGDTSLTALNRLPGPSLGAGWAVWAWLIAVLLGVIQLGGIALTVGECLSETIGLFEPLIWGPIVCAVCLVILFNGRYQVVEKVSTVLVSLFSISIIVSALMIQWTPYAITWAQLTEGFSFQMPRAAEFVEGGGGIALAVVAAVGLSATEIIYYPYWCVEKGYARWCGPNEPTDEWEARARGWIRVMQLDCIFAMLIYTTTTLAFYLLGAAVLHAQQIVPQKMEIITTLSAMYTETYGDWAYWLFVGCSFLVLFSTLFVSIAGYSRLLPDCFRLMGIIQIDDEVSRRLWVRRFLVFCAVLFALGSQLTRLDIPPLAMIVTGILPIAVLLPIVCLAVVYLRYARLDERLRPSVLLDVWLWASVFLTSVITLRAFQPLLERF